MSAELELQQAIFNLLRTDAPLRALLAPNPYSGSPSEPAIYDTAPQADEPEEQSAFPYVVLGEDTAVEFDTDDVDGHEHTVTLHVFDRREGRRRAKQVIGALYDALHNAALSVSGHDAVFCFFDFSGAVPDPEPLTQHEVIRFRIVTQEA